MAASNFQALAVKLAATKGGKGATNVKAAYRPAGPGSIKYPGPQFHGRPGSNAGPFGGRQGIGGVPGYKSVEPRFGRPKASTRASQWVYRTASGPTQRD